jgi:hypothetical protein
MIRFAKSLAVAGLLFAVGCSGTPAIQTLGATYTLQGIVADAVTGARLGGDLKLFLIQGPEVRGPSRLITGTTDPLMGEYAFAGIPVAFAAGNSTWKVVAIRSNYQRFESEITFVGALGIGGTTIDQAFSRIGNIYLFPTGVTAPDYTFQTLYNGKPVQGATIQLDPISASNGNTFINGGAGDTLPAFNGYVASLSAQTDAAGKATFPGNLLAVGGMYNVQVLPVAFKEPITGTIIQLGLTPATGPGAKPSIIAGLTAAVQVIALADLTPSTSAVPLYIADASNKAANQVQPNGTLVVTFNIPVTLVNPNGFNAAFNPGTKADGVTAGTGALNTTQNVNASLSADGLTLTLAPNYTGSGGQAPAATDRGVAIRYAEGTAMIIAKDYPSRTFSVLSPSPGPTLLHFADGTSVETGVVVISGP